MSVFRRHILSLGLALFSGASLAGESPVSLNAQPVTLCDPPQQCAQIGSLRILGFLSIPPRSINGLRIGSLSGLAWDDDEELLYALSDHGALIALRPIFRNDRLVDVRFAHAVALIDPMTKKPVKWRRSDSEGLDVVNGRNGKRGDTELIVSFEREPRIARYRPDGTFIADVPLPEVLRDPKHYRGGNKMLESVCLHPREGVLTAPEEPLENEPAPRLYRRDGASWRIPPGRGGIVALECLADGNVLVLERDFDMTQLRTIITLRRLNLQKDNLPNSLLTADTVAAFDSTQGLRLDNFEGFARHRGNRFFLVSDENGVFLQHTFLLYVEMVGH
ncbi:MAG: esterase-like activity of phytase family protein [Gammaproteobacteria bacterium]|nr:esterase-like activity of phytase family protein [Gammaproteobacteria bacterium]